MTSIQLILGQEPFVAGYSVAGSIVLNIRLLQDEAVEGVHVKLSGHMHGTYRNSQSTERKNIGFLHQRVPIWKRGQAYPPAGSDVLILPFNLPLRSDLPPCLVAEVGRLRTSIKYTLHVIAERPGLLRFNKDIKREVNIQSHAAVSAPVQAQLIQGWDGPWTTVRMSERIVKYFLWGKYADVDAHFAVPAINAVPIYTAIPFTVSVKTISRPYAKDYEGELWPSPPHRTEAFKFELIQHLTVRVRRKHRGCVTLRQALGPLHFEHSKKEWIPQGGGLGKWKQETTLQSSIRLVCPPAFVFVWEGETQLAVSYYLRVTVKFSAMHRLTFEQPITVVHQTPCSHDVYP